MKCSASDGLTLYSVIAFWVMTVLQPAKIAPAACIAYLLLCDILDLINATSLGAVQHQELQTLVHAFLAASAAAGWRDWMGPKWLVHVSGICENWGVCCPALHMSENTSL